MYEVIKLLFDICLFKKGPADLPYSFRLRKVLIFAYAIVRFLMLNFDLGWRNVLLQVTVEIIFIWSFSWIMLYCARRLQRFCQVTSAFYGTFALIGFFALPGAASIAIGHGGWLVFIAMLVLISWFCAVTAHIIYHTLDQRLSLSIGVAFLFLMGSYLLLDFLYPDHFGII
ncbi:MAG: hypothetical protein ACXWTH_04390 [Methylosarcina sp.]